MSTSKPFRSSVFVVLFILCTIIFLNPVSCSENSIESESSNSTMVQTIFDSFVKCYIRSTEKIRGIECLKEKLFLALDQTVRRNLNYVFTEEEKAELARYNPIFKKIGRILKKNIEGPWLDTKIMHHLKMLMNEDDSAEGRKKKGGKGIGQFLIYPLLMGAMFIPVAFKVLAAVAAKALIVGKAALIISALLFFNKTSLDSPSETTVQHQVLLGWLEVTYTNTSAL